MKRIKILVKGFLFNHVVEETHDKIFVKWKKNAVTITCYDNDKITYSLIKADRVLMIAINDV